jgi:hypothetical protein
MANQSFEEGEIFNSLMWVYCCITGLVILRNHYPLATTFVSTTLYATEPGQVKAYIKRT